MTRLAFSFLAVLLTAVSASAQQKTVTIAVVNSPAMIELKKFAPKFEAANPDIRLNCVVVEENILRSAKSSSTSRYESEKRKYLPTARRITSGSN
jgi:ABC-type glycerol-3-phosphate transport system substrate-binding protein